MIQKYHLFGIFQGDIKHHFLSFITSHNVCYVKQCIAKNRLSTKGNIFIMNMIYNAETPLVNNLFIILYFKSSCS